MICEHAHGYAVVRYNVYIEKAVYDRHLLKHAYLTDDKQLQCLISSDYKGYKYDILH